MKLVVMMYLEEDEKAVESLVSAHEVRAFSSLPLEGHGAGTAGWYGEVAPYQSRMLFTLVPTDRARELMDAVRACSGCRDMNHPVHAIQVDLEDVVHSGPTQSEEIEKT